MPGLQRRHHAQALRRAQDLWDLDCAQDAVAVLEAVQPRLHPKTVATDAMIVATLATYVSELGDARRGVALMSQIPLDGTRLTEVHLICLGARCQCRAAAGDLEGALHDRETICGCDPKHPALALADTALAMQRPTEAAERPA